MSDEKRNDGGPAFPGSADTEEGHQMREYGMTLRDYFAGQALAAEELPAGLWSEDEETAKEVAQRHARAMCRIADAMLTASAKR